jgi:hypothetical protein
MNMDKLPDFKLSDPRLEEIVRLALLDKEGESGLVALLDSAPKSLRRAAAKVRNATYQFHGCCRSLKDLEEDSPSEGMRDAIQKEYREAAEDLQETLAAIEVKEDLRTPLEIMAPFFERVEEIRAEDERYFDRALEEARSSVHRRGMRYDCNANRGPDGTVWWSDLGNGKFTTKGQRVTGDEEHKMALRSQNSKDGWQCAFGNVEWAWRPEEILPGETPRRNHRQETNFESALYSLKRATTEMVVAEHILSRREEIVAWAVKQDAQWNRFADCPEDMKILFDFLKIVPESAQSGGGLICALHHVLDDLNGYPDIRMYMY